jgi:hypothetical protein
MLPPANRLGGFTYLSFAATTLGALRNSTNILSLNDRYRHGLGLKGPLTEPTLLR